ncbi:PDZ domain-containing protein [Terrimonas alba]|uniref:PDZ domain-containing protein n=1 Tax=Terrimonas alba TaxID=3349636 RepID=UPI0035F25FFF
MKQLIKTISLTILAAGFMAPGSLLAQKEKEDKEKKEAEQIIITRKGKKEDKVVVEVIGDKVIVNGKELKGDDKDGDISVKRHKIKDVWAFGGNDNFNSNFNGDHFKMFNMDENKAMLGVSTEQADKGAQVENVTEGSAAEKAGLKKGDVIIKIGDSKIESPDDLSKAIKARKPGDKVVVTFLRDKKEQTVTAELTKWKGVNVFTTVPGMEGFKMDLGDFAPHVQTLPRGATPRMNWSWSGGGPKLGISVQDTEDGKGVNVIEVDEEGNAAKAGIKEDDIITEVDGKAVNSADEIAKLMKENKDKVSVKVKLLRKGRTENVEVKIPRKLKTADL